MESTIKENPMTKQRQYKATDIALWFLNYNLYLRDIEGQDTDEISNTRLNKLLYYAQGSYMALRDKSLFSDKIIATPHGPIVKQVYEKYLPFENRGITEFDTHEPFDDDTEGVLQGVYKTFGKYSNRGLRDLVVQEDPFRSTKIGKEIKKNKIKEYFKREYLEK